MAAGKSRRARVSLHAEQKGNHVLIKVSDDGAGIDELGVRELALRKGLISEAQAREMSRRELLNLLFLPGFSTARSVSGSMTANPRRCLGRVAVASTVVAVGWAGDSCRVSPRK